MLLKFASRFPGIFGRPTRTYWPRLESYGYSKASRPNMAVFFGTPLPKVQSQAISLDVGRRGRQTPTVQAARDCPLSSDLNSAAREAFGRSTETLSKQRYRAARVIMRIATIISNLGIQIARLSAKLIVCNDADCPVYARLQALLGVAPQQLLAAASGAKQHWPSVAGGVKPFVTCGASFAIAEHRSRRTHHTTMRRFAAS